MKRALLCLALLAVACDEAPAAAPDELTIVVQGDRRELEQQEKSLREREEQFRNDKQQLDARIAELARGLKAAADAEQRHQLETELRQKQEQEGQMSAQERMLRAQKNEMEARRQAIDADGERARAAALQVREAAVVAREARLAARESELSQREHDVTAQQRQLMELEQKIALELKTPPAAAARSVPRSEAIDQKHRKLLAELDGRGVLISDLSPEEQPLNAEIFAARRSGDFVRAGDLLQDFARAVARVKVDQKFVEQKIVRLQALRAQAHLTDAQRAEVERGLREVTSAYSDGHYEQANKALNQLATLLDASAQPG